MARKSVQHARQATRVPGNFNVTKFSAFEFSNLLYSMSKESASLVNAMLEIAHTDMQNMEAAGAWAEQQKIVEQLRAIVKTGGNDALNRLADTLRRHGTN